MAEEPVECVFDEETQEWNQEGCEEEDVEEDAEEMVEEMEEEEFGEWHEKIEPMSGQITWTVTSLVVAAWFGMKAFYFTGADLSETTVPKKSDNEKNRKEAQGGTDYIHLSEQLANYGGLGLWGVGALLQLVSWAGVAIPINLLWWGTVMHFGEFYMLFTKLILWLGYNSAHSYWKDNRESTDATKKSYAAYSNTMMKEARNTLIADGAREALIIVELGSSALEWMAFQWTAMKPEEREAILESLKEDDGEEEEMEEEVEEEECEGEDCPEEEAEEEAAATTDDPFGLIRKKFFLF